MLTGCPSTLVSIFAFRSEVSQAANMSTIPTFPNQEQILRSHTHAAYDGAFYHLRTIDRILKQPLLNHPSDSASIDEETRREIRNLWSEVHWHTRAFFWELAALFDTLLRWANERYELGALKRHDFKWWDEKGKKGLAIRTAGKDPDDWNAKRELIDGIWKSAWFNDVSEYRNHSHEAFLTQIAEYEAVPNNGKFEPVRFARTSLVAVGKVRQQDQLDLVGQLDDYLTKMGVEANKIFDTALLQSPNTKED
jgi:hypothetical protein